MRRSIQVVLIWMGTGITLMVLLAGCASSAGVCDVHPYADLSGVAEFIEDDGVPFRFPLAETNSAATSSNTLFCNLEPTLLPHTAKVLMFFVQIGLGSVRRRRLRANPCPDQGKHI